MKKLSILFLTLLFTFVVAFPSLSFAKTYTVKIKNFAFKPQIITIHKGDRIRWINKDVNILHQPQGKNFTSPILMTGDTFIKKFKKVGIHKYHCAIHDFMKARVIVQ